MSLGAATKAYVSASSRGLGLEIARRLAQDGAEIAISGRDKGRLEEAQAAILHSVPEAKIGMLTGDLANRKDQEHLLEQLEERQFAPDIFICSAGQPRDVQLPNLSRHQWEHDLEMLLGQAVFAVQRFAPSMARKGFGRFVFISSTLAKYPRRTFVTSSIARAGLFALSKTIVDEYGAQGVASYVLCLGFVDTPLLRNMALNREFADSHSAQAAEGSRSWESKYGEWAAQIPVRRIGSPLELASLVSFLCSPAAEYLTGSVLSFSGGLDRGLL